MKLRFVAILLVVLLSGTWSVNTTAEAATEVTVKSEKQMVNALHETFLNRGKDIVIKYSIKGYKLNPDALIEKVLAKNDKRISKDYDYLKYSLGRWGCSGVKVNNTTTINFKFSYKTTLKQEKALDKKVKSILEELDLEEATDYEKVKAIHDYIVNLVSYDTELMRFSAYNALIDKAAVCEGYSMLAYLMFTEVGLESRIIDGYGNRIEHSWNIVKVDDKWYNIDLTWDDPITSNGEPMLVYDYFLKSNEDFTGHIRNAEFETEKFVKTYPISKTSYEME